MPIISKNDFKTSKEITNLKFVTPEFTIMKFSLFKRLMRSFILFKTYFFRLFKATSAILKSSMSSMSIDLSNGIMYGIVPAVKKDFFSL